MVNILYYESLEGSCYAIFILFKSCKVLENFNDGNGKDVFKEGVLTLTQVQQSEQSSATSPSENSEEMSDGNE